MDISDYYLSVGQKRNISHFANIVRIAKSDGIIAVEEVSFLQKVARRYNIENDKFTEILKNPEKFPTIGHLENLERINRLYDLIVMIKSDHVIATEEVSVLKKIVIGLSFPLHEVSSIVNKALSIDIENSSLESFQNEILNVVKEGMH